MVSKDHVKEHVIESGFTHIFDLKDITGDDHGSFDLEEPTVTENDGLQSQSLLELVDDRPGLEFLDETDGGVEKEQGADDTEVHPILESGGENGSSLPISKSVIPSLRKHDPIATEKGGRRRDDRDSLPP